MTSHYDKNQPGQYTPPKPKLPSPYAPKKKMPLWAKIVLFVLAVPVVLAGGCMAIVGGSLAAETVSNSGADPTPVISTQSPIARETPRGPKPVEVAPTKPKPTRTAPARTESQRQAIASAESYLKVSAFSRYGLIQQLSSAYGEGFSKADATYAVDHITVDWNEQAAKSARSYLNVTSFSRAGLIEQLESKHGEGFTHAQAVYGVNAVGLR